MSLGKITHEISERFCLAFTYTPDCLLGLHNEANDNYNLLSHILLIFKYYIYISREKRILNIDILIANSVKVKKRERRISIGTINKREAHQKIGALQITFYQ